MTAYYYVRPTDTLFVRGNLAFGDAGEHGASLMPPPPSLFAGAFRSALLGKDAGEMSAFLQDGRCTGARLSACLGTSDAPGDFRIAWLSFAGLPDCDGSGAGGEGGTPEAVLPFPADLLYLESGFARLEPRALPAGIASAGDLPLRATLISSKQEKPRTGFYLREAGLSRHLQGQLPMEFDRVETGAVHQRDPRLGIGLSSESRSVEEGLIYSTEGFAFSPRHDPTIQEQPVMPFATTGFLVGVEGADGLLPESGLLRLGGDGRSAFYQRVNFAPLQADGIADRFRLVLQTPAVFAQGWLPNGVSREGEVLVLRGPGFTACLVCAAFARREVVSGWDLFNSKPKSAQGGVPAGSVYWFDQLREDAPGKLAVWVAGGLWGENPDRQRRAEGYNRAWLAAWPND